MPSTMSKQNSAALMATVLDGRKSNAERVLAEAYNAIMIAGDDLAALVRKARRKLRKTGRKFLRRMR